MIDAFTDFEAIFTERIAEADAFYASVQQNVLLEESRIIPGQAWANLIWNRQFNTWITLSGFRAIRHNPDRRIIADRFAIVNGCI